MKYFGLKVLRIMLEKARPNLEIALAGAVSVLLTLGLMSSLMAWGAYVSTLPETQYLDLTMLIQNHKGAPVGQAHVVVFELADGGPRKLSEGIADNVGTYRARLQLPRKLAREKSAMLERGAAVEEGEARDIYASVNLWVVAYSVGEESGNQVVDIGTLTFSVDPTFMKHPLDSAANTIVLSRVEKPQAFASPNEGSASVVGLSPQKVVTSSCQIPTYPYQEESWAYTTVLKFATWDNIEARYEYFSGSKIRVESKQRYFVIGTCSYASWTSSGSTIVTVDQDRSSDWLTGRTVYTMNFQLKYYFIRYCPPYQSTVLVEKVYAVDTSQDGYVAVRTSSSWSGSLPSWSYYTTVNQLETIPKDIAGTTSGYSFSVGVSVSFYGVGVGISLGVGKEPSPASKLYIHAGTWTSGYLVKVVSKDGTYLETYSNWVPP
ncbi:MAG: hypothetical protein QXP45_02075 [Thermoproteota archaeon]